MRGTRLLRDPLAWLVLLLGLLLFEMQRLRGVFAWLFPHTEPSIYPDDSFATLFVFHAELVVLSSLAATIIGVGLAIIATRPWGAVFRPLLQTLATIGQTFPPVAVLALAVPAFGYGPVPTMIALTLYGILPILTNTLAGLAGVPASTREAGEGMGLTPFELLRDVELPLAAPTILAGIRLSTIINIGTAAIGSTVGAVTLGNPIIGGLVTGKIAYVVQGAIVVGLFAIVTDLLFARLDRRLRRFALRD
jgi:osmoprotectant transport system permease protein